MLLQTNDLVLFQGDSITDCARKREITDSLGDGYARITASILAARYPEMNLAFVNRGISGNRTSDLLKRWQEDCIDLEPDVLSILIGVNDVWRHFDSGDATSAAAFQENYREILERTRAALPSVRLILMEPFVLPVPADRRAWRSDLDPKIAIVRELAGEYGALYVPLDGLFAAAACRQHPAYWAEDGVHPSAAGHGLIADAWIQTIGG